MEAPLIGIEVVQFAESLRRGINVAKTSSLSPSFAGGESLREGVRWIAVTAPQ